MQEKTQKFNITDPSNTVYAIIYIYICNWMLVYHSKYYIIVCWLYNVMG